jgi:hydroxymethylpyrimidine pyrophosphatase-like HAD family hydrolase
MSGDRVTLGFWRMLLQPFRPPKGAAAAAGDKETNRPMFRRTAFSIATGNASAAVKAAAHAVALANDEDGFAHAVHTIIVPRAVP